MCKLCLGPTIIESSGIGPPHPACAQIIQIIRPAASCASSCHFSLSRPSGAALLLSLSGRQGSPGRSKVRGRLIPHTWGTESALRRETRPTMGDRRMVFGDGLEDIKVKGKSVKKTLSLKPRIVFLGRCRPMVEVVGEDSSLDLSSSDPFSCFGFLASQSHSLLSPRSERFYSRTVRVNLNIFNHSGTLIFQLSPFPPAWMGLNSTTQTSEIICGHWVTSKC